jgi:cold shock CspA family protein
MLFKVADRLLAAQQTPIPKKIGEAWDHYFPFFAENVTEGAVSDQSGTNAFIAFLRFSYYRPRDITSMIGTIREIINAKKQHADYVTAGDFSDPSFRDAHAEYLLGESRDQLLFYYSQDEFDLFLQFFSHLRGKRKFSYDEFLDSFNEFIIECKGGSGNKALPQFFDSADIFLQFLFEQNVICYKERDPAEEIREGEPFIRWCFRERTLANMSPKVRTGVDYEIFYGLSKALNVGREIKVRSPKTQRHVGTIISVNTDEGYGFIRGGEKHEEYYFKLSECKFGKKITPQVSWKVSFEVHAKYGKLRAHSIARAS